MLKELFITLKIYCALPMTVVTNSICDSKLGFTIQKFYILIPPRTAKKPFYTSLKKFMKLVIAWMYRRNYITIVRDGSTITATSKMELFVKIVHGWKLWLYKFSFFIYIFKLFTWRLFYLIARFIVLFY